jgi:hypothetical protein
VPGKDGTMIEEGESVLVVEHDLRLERTTGDVAESAHAAGH